MKRDNDALVWMTAGALGSMLLSIALIPLRSVTSASNLAFAFLALTIVVAELGGRPAALVTAVVSAMSLNFFLTEPYLTLAISKRDDVVAFFALAGCGLIAAAFGRRRERWSERAGRAGRELGVVKDLVDQLRNGTEPEAVLADLKRTFGLRAIVLRDGAGRVLASTPGSGSESVPETQLMPDSLAPADETRLRFGTRGLRLPEGGGRLSLSTNRGRISLDLWEGDPRGFDLQESRLVTVAGSILGLALSRQPAG